MSTTILYFDGHCNLCNNSVDFVITRDKKRVFRFAPLQGETAKDVLGVVNIDLEHPDSFVLSKDNKVYFRSTAALMVARQLGFPWSLTSLFLVVPPFIRDAVYNLIARNRYKWFGRKETCRLPSPEERSLFLD